MSTDLDSGSLTITLIWCIFAVILLSFFFNNFMGKQFLKRTIKFLPCSGNLQFLTLIIIVIGSLLINWIVVETAWQVRDVEVRPLKEWGIHIKGYDFSFYRGKNYNLGSGLSKDIFLTDHNIHHFGMYILAGLMAPDLWVVWVIVGIWWEMLESFKGVECHDYMDFVCNWSGLLIGVFIRNYLEKRLKNK